MSPNDNILSISPSDIVSLAINPIKGFRRDDNVTKFRSFLLELDRGNLKSQYNYIIESKIPTSACVFSGNKSLHFAIVLEKPVISKQIWQFYNQWMLNILKEADQQVKNPSRSIRFPGNIRKETDKEQKLLYINKRINLNDLIVWLNKFPQKKPVPQTYTPKINACGTLQSIPKWVKEILENGITTDRNKTWFRIAAVLASCNYSYDEAISILEQFYEEEKDFRGSEWARTIQSAYKHVYGA